MIECTKSVQGPDANFDYAMSILEEHKIKLPAISPKETKHIYQDEGLTILLRSCGFNKALFVLRIKNPETGKPTSLYSNEFCYNPTV